MSNTKLEQSEEMSENALVVNVSFSAVPPDDQYVLVRQESDMYWEKHSMKWRLGSNRYYNMLPQCILMNFPSVVSPVISTPPDIPLPVKAVLQHRFQLHM